jgi:hypothetical protein
MSLLKKKATVMNREMANRLTLRLPSLTVTEGVDASGNPQITINDGTPAAGEQNFYIRVLELPSIGVNSVGGAADSFGPHAIQVAMEATAAAATVALTTAANQLAVMGECLKMGPRVEVYLSANGAAPDVTTIAAGNLVGTFDSLYFSFVGTM